MSKITIYRTIRGQLCSWAAKRHQYSHQQHGKDQCRKELSDAPVMGQQPLNLCLSKSTKGLRLSENLISLQQNMISPLFEVELV